MATTPGSPEHKASGADWLIYCDGCALPNPGHMGLGAILTGPDGTRHAMSIATHRIGCNNEAELRALIAALRALQARSAASVEVRSDSSILVEQLSGAQTVKPIVRLSALFEEARALLQHFECVHLQWVPQHRNREADALARAALGLPARASPPLRRRARATAGPTPHE